MSSLEKLDAIASEFGPDLGVATGKWFGKPCIKAGDKVFVILWGKDLAFKLAGDAHAQALKIEGAHLFDPRGKGHAMKEWVQIPATQSSVWSRFAHQAHDYVTTREED